MSELVTNLRSSKSWRVLAIVLIAGSFAYYLHLRSDYALCDMELQRVLYGPNGDKVTMETRFCSQFAGDPGTVVLRYQRDGEIWDHIIFAYNPISGGPNDSNPPWYPDVRWDGPENVIVSISKISQIQQRRNVSGNVNFTYNVGKIEYQ